MGATSFEFESVQGWQVHIPLIDICSRRMIFLRDFFYVSMVLTARY